MKKIDFVFFILICLLLFGNLFVKADLIDSVDSNIQKVEDTKNKIDNLKDTNSSYLAEEWKKIILGNPVFGAIDKFLESISLVFKILMQEPYSLTLKFFIILILWLFVFFNISKLLGESLFEGGIAYAIGFVVTMILAYVKTFELFYSFLVGIVDLFSGGMKYVIVALIFVVFILVQVLSKYFDRYLRLERIRQEKEGEKINRWSLKRIVDIYKKST